MPLIIRSMISVPAIREKFLQNARALPADVVCFDLEDSVAPADKDRARDLLAAFLPTFPARGRLAVVRINGLDTGRAEPDLAAVVGPGLHGINLPKCHNPRIVQEIDAYLTFIERTRRLPDGQVKLIPWIESGEGVARALDVCAASPRIIAVTFGADDYATDTGVIRTYESGDLLVPRALTANAAAAAGIVALDTPTTEFRDTAKFEADLLAARRLGYRGKFCVHPTQVEIANRVFAPSDDELAWARKVIAAYDEGRRKGLGAIDLDGKLIDDPVVDRAHQLLDWRRAVDEREALLASS